MLAKLILFYQWMYFLCVFMISLHDHAPSLMKYFLCLPHCLVIIIWYLLSLRIKPLFEQHDAKEFKSSWSRFSSPEDTVGVFKNHILEVSQSKRKNKYKWWSYIKTFWVLLCYKMTNFPMEMSDCIWQHQKYARPEIYVVTLVYTIYLIFRLKRT